MKNKLKRILLVDDDEPTNFLNRMVIEELECTEEIITVTSGERALEYLTTQSDGQYPQPDLIFLDINMPGMNGWEFLEEYKNIEDFQKGNITVVMLTTSVNPSDLEKAQAISGIKKFMHKPLTEEHVVEVINTHFSNLLDS